MVFLHQKFFLSKIIFFILTSGHFFSLLLERGEEWGVEEREERQRKREREREREEH